MARKRDDTVKLVLRLPPALHRRLARVAERRNHSLNSEMVKRLEQSFAPQSVEAEMRLRRAIREAYERLSKDDGEEEAKAARTRFLSPVQKTKDDEESK